jgi:catechol 2,3-dioxygenase-like lactoylglutathione lyase family enzyme
MRGTVQHIAITVSNMERSLAFYKDLLDSEVLYQMQRTGAGIEKIVGVPGAKLKVAMLQAPNTEVELLEYVKPRGRAFDLENNDVGRMHFCLQVENMDEAYASLCEKGVRFVNPPVKVTKGRTKGWIVAYLLDPDGLSIELCQLPPEGSFVPSHKAE